MKKTIETVGHEVATVLQNIDEHEAEQFSKTLLRSNRIFVYGEGRSGLMGKAFAMRLMHSGLHVFVVGETVTPNIEKGDLLVVISGSGSFSEIVKKAKYIGAEIFLVTSNMQSEIAQISNGILNIPAATKYRKAHEPKTIQPLGNQFDQSVHLVLDAIIIYSFQKEYSNKDLNEEMRKRHTNLE